MNSFPHDLRIWILSSDSSAPIGGVKQIHRFSSILSQLGCFNKIVSDSSDFDPGWFSEPQPTLSYKEWRSTPLDFRRDIILLPETFILKKYKLPDVYKIIFNQNASYTLGVSPYFYSKYTDKIIKAYHDPDVLHVLCVSKYDQRFLSSLLSIKSADISLVVNGIESCFAPLTTKFNKCCFMARKNKYIRQTVLSYLSTTERYRRFDWQSLHNVSHSSVLDSFRESICYLNFGHPEGFGLPVAEALSCSTAVVGFNQLGTSDIYQLVDKFNVFFPSEFNDFLSFHNAFSLFCDEYFHNRTAFLANLSRASEIVRDYYSMDRMRSSLADALGVVSHKLSLLSAEPVC